MVRRVLALFGLGFLLFLAGLEIDPHRQRGAIERVVVALLLSFGLAFAAGRPCSAWRRRRHSSAFGLSVALFPPVALALLSRPD
jgi:Kef-type K+ transport system membrane component KefB